MTEYFTKYPYLWNQTTHLHGILKHHTVHQCPGHRRQTFYGCSQINKKKNPVYICAFMTLTKLLINSSLVIYLLFFAQAFFKTKFCIPKQLLWSAMCGMHAICRMCTNVSSLSVQGQTHAVLCCGRPQHFKTWIWIGLLDFWHFTIINWQKNKLFKTPKLKSNYTRKER
jgi:hypothetical protein